VIAKINAQSNDYPRNLDVNGFPTIFYIRADKKDDPITFTGMRELKDLMQFIGEQRSNQDWEMPAIPAMKSESRPASDIDENGVTVAVGESFEELVVHNENDVFVEFYTPWCGHCKQLEPNWNALAGKLKGKPITIAKMNADANDVPPPFDVSGYPTLYYVRKDSKQSPISFDGSERDVDGLLAFIDKHRSDNSWSLPVSEKTEL